MKIQEFSQQTGLSTKTIRYYESIGILRSPQRAPNGYREYSEQDLERALCSRSAFSGTFSGRNFRIARHAGLSRGSVPNHVESDQAQG